MIPADPRDQAEQVSGEFEQHARALLEESVLRVDGRVRSRLNQARHAAVGEVARPRTFWRRVSFMPAVSAVAAAVMVAFVLWPHSQTHTHRNDAGEISRAPVEDLDLIADSDALDLVSEAPDGGAFYEWALDQSDPNEPSGAGA